ASPTEVPPYFWTTRAMTFLARAGGGRIQPTNPPPPALPRCATATTPRHGTVRPHLAGRPGDPAGARTSSDRHLPAAGEAAAQGGLVGVLEVAADGEAAGDAGDPDAEGVEEAGQVHGRGLALDVWGGGQDDPAAGVRLQAAQQLADAEGVRGDPLAPADWPAHDVGT